MWVAGADVGLAVPHIGVGLGWFLRGHLWLQRMEGRNGVVRKRWIEG